METINETSKLVAQAIEKLKCYDIFDSRELEDVIKLLEDALSKLTKT
jgi:hypothetical protein